MRLKSWHYVILGLIFSISVHFTEQICYQLNLGFHPTADDPSYYQPAFNFLNGNGWKDNSIGASAYVSRPPILGVFYFISKFIAGKHFTIIIYFFALLFHALAIKNLYQLLEKLKSTYVRTVILFLYIFLPCFWGFLSYGITETFSSSFVIIACSLIIQQKDENRFLMTFCVLLFFLLFRPVIGLIFVPILIHSFFLFSLQKNLFNRHLIASFLLIILNGMWQMRVYSHVGNFSFHPIYHESNLSEYRPPHQKLGELFKIWEFKPETVHYWVGKSYSNQEISFKEIKSYCNEIHSPISEKKLYSVLLHLKSCYQEQKINFSKGKSLTLSLHEKQLIKSIEEEYFELKNKNRFKYFLSTPIKSAVYLLSKSQLNLSIFQEKFRGAFIVELLRYLCLIVLICSFIAVILSTINTKKEFKFIAIGILVYFFYLIYFQRLNEDRYLVPFQGLSIVFLAFQLIKIQDFIRKKGTFIFKNRSN